MSDLFKGFQVPKKTPVEYMARRQNKRREGCFLKVENPQNYKGL